MEDITSIGYNVYDLIKTKHEAKDSYEKDVLRAIFSEKFDCLEEMEDYVGNVETAEALMDTFWGLPEEEQVKYLKINDMWLTNMPTSEEGYLEFTVEYELDLEKFRNDYMLTNALPDIEESIEK